VKTVKTVHGKKTISKTRHVEVQMNKPKDDEVQLRYKFALKKHIIAQTST